VVLGQPWRKVGDTYFNEKKLSGGIRLSSQQCQDALNRKIMVQGPSESTSPK
jgi:hypothetical protein